MGIMDIFGNLGSMSNEGFTKKLAFIFEKDNFKKLDRNEQEMLVRGILGVITSDKAQAQMEMLGAGVDHNTFKEMLDEIGEDKAIDLIIDAIEDGRFAFMPVDKSVDELTEDEKISMMSKAMTDKSVKKAWANKEQILDALSNSLKNIKKDVYISSCIEFCKHMSMLSILNNESSSITKAFSKHGIDKVDSIVGSQVNELLPVLTEYFLEHDIDPDNAVLMLLESTSSLSMMLNMNMNGYDSNNLQNLVEKVEKKELDVNNIKVVSKETQENKQKQKKKEKVKDLNSLLLDD